MSRGENPNWSDLLLESSAHPLPIAAERYRAWMAGRQIFVSSLMDQEMTPYRDAVRAHLHAMGATPVMWEEITPRDEGPQQAYLGGVDRSPVFVLMLGSRYGVTDQTGYSPTHQEGNRAAERRIPRLLFTLGTLNDPDRDGRLNDWLRSLRNELSGGSFANANDLVGQLDARLREMAARSERLWIKLGALVFPGIVNSRFDNRGEGEITVTANVTDGEVRRALVEGGQSYRSRSRAERITWSNNSFPIQIESVSVKTEYSAEEQVEIACKSSQSWNAGSSSIHTMMGSFGKLTAAEMAELWARRAILGEDYRDGGGALDMTASFSEPETVILPEVLRACSAGGWLAEGLTRLYSVEEVSRRYDGHFQYLDVGPSTATSIRIRGAFTFGAMGSRNESIAIEGNVPLLPGQ
ncbi:MAG: hypothetical protein QOE96_3268 [Blastocatellia bacterium]|jgi:hypothetical protein|nr:hypothetical protein [Blastocatellia bacterium]